MKIFRFVLSLLLVASCASTPKENADTLKRLKSGREYVQARLDHF